MDKGAIRAFPHFVILFYISTNGQSQSALRSALTRSAAAHICAIGDMVMQAIASRGASSAQPESPARHRSIALAGSSPSSVLHSSPPCFYFLKNGLCRPCPVLVQLGPLPALPRPPPAPRLGHLEHKVLARGPLRPAPGPAPKQQRPALRLPALASDLPARRFDPFADELVPSTSQNTPPPRGRPLTPLVVASPAPTPSPAAPAPAPAIKGRRRAPSFSAGCPRSASTSTILLSTPIPPSRVTTPVAPVAGAPTPFHARHYPTPDARARLLARTLLNRIHAVGRPRSPYASLSSPYSRSASPYAGGGGLCNGYESECGARGYVPSRLSECVAAC
ncbi:hypothetical protein B0H17DRAFT_1207884 [Mycena rosella]|uniref:Uncharacterized protein n=1 Tax=Mycena rosella TaxID=1033263 RepID=A0AAD7D2G3_MYCRO|nr:hypothetical protein B0H17DRAFT_1207884 [Mycena rosella]